MEKIEKILQLIDDMEASHKQVYGWIITELRAGMVLEPKDEGDRMWNHCTLRAISIVKKYEQGIGLFQEDVIHLKRIINK